MNNCAARWSGVSTRIRLSTHGEFRYWVNAGAPGSNGVAAGFLPATALARAFLAGTALLFRPAGRAADGVGAGPVRRWAGASNGATNTSASSVKDLRNDKGKGGIFYAKVAPAAANFFPRRAARRDAADLPFAERKPDIIFQEWGLRAERARWCRVLCLSLVKGRRLPQLNNSATDAHLCEQECRGLK